MFDTADDTVVPIAQIVHPISSDIVTLLLQEPLLEGLFRLTVTSNSGQTVFDEVGNLLDGDGNGAAGGDFTGFFEVVPVLATDDTFEVDEDATLAADVSLNDVPNLTYTLDTDVSHGDLMLNPDGTFTYTPDADYHGSDVFVYIAEDAFGHTGLATAFITVRSINDAPVLDPIGDRMVDEEQTLQFTVTASDANDLPADNLTLSVSGLPAGATFDSQTGLFQWTPSEAQQGSYQVTFTVTDDGVPALSDSEQITITVNEVNEPPVAVDDSATTNEGTSVTVDVIANDTDPDGDVLSLQVRSAILISATDDQTGDPIAITDASVTQSGNEVTFDPGTDFAFLAAGETATVVIDYVVEDGHGGSDTGTLTITVTGIGLVGDFDNDGTLDGDDIDALNAVAIAGTHDPQFDLTGDGLVTVADVRFWITDVKLTLLADANLDFVVDGLDFITWNQHKFSATTRWTEGDFNADGFVDGADFTTWNANKFRSASPPAPQDPLIDAAFAGEVSGLVGETPEVPIAVHQRRALEALCQWRDDDEEEVGEMAELIFSETWK
jgi:hypothetical protein